MKTKESGSIINDFSSNKNIDEYIKSKPIELSISRSALIRFGVILAMKRLEGKDKEKARKLISSTIL